MVSRHRVVFDSNAFEGEIMVGLSPAGDGTYLEPQPVVQHMGALGEGFRVANPTRGRAVESSELYGYVENFPRDVVAALPGHGRPFAPLTVFCGSSTESLLTNFVFGYHSNSNQDEVESPRALRLALPCPESRRP